MVSLLTAAIAVVALLGIGTASATTLCKAKENPCSEPNSYKLNTEAEGSLEGMTQAVFKGELKFGTVMCSKANIQFKMTSNEGPEKAMHGQVTVLRFEECEGCKKATVLHLPYSAEIHANLAEVGHGELNFSNSGKGVPAVEFTECALGIACTFGEKALQMTIFGGNPAGVFEEEEPLVYEAGSPFCGTKALLTMSFVISKPKPLWVSAKP
jgi:hypothetical protein